MERPHISKPICAGMLERDLLSVTGSSVEKASPDLMSFSGI
ncbi:unnamed protein product [Staurois parvus]|uniref:Uncharacterized protein n=1 Tax=Staurois parvus TaxID=386267 RepID=A0ABN9H831_9NEOB|nr:unnamed protein product [Staurois parvus]